MTIYILWKLIESRLTETFAIYVNFAGSYFYFLFLFFNSTLTVVALFSCLGIRLLCVWRYWSQDYCDRPTITIWKQTNKQTKLNFDVWCINRLHMFTVFQTVIKGSHTCRSAFLFFFLFNKCGMILVNRANFVCFPSNSYAPEGQHSGFNMNEMENPWLWFQLSWLTLGGIWADAHIHLGEQSVLKARCFFYSEWVYRFIPLSSLRVFSFRARLNMCSLCPTMSMCRFSCTSHHNFVPV